MIRQTNSQPIVQMTAKEFMFGYESPLTTLGNRFMPDWISFEKVGLIDRVSSIHLIYWLTNFINWLFIPWNGEFCSFKIIGEKSSEMKKIPNDFVTSYAFHLLLSDCIYDVTMAVKSSLP